MQGEVWSFIWMVASALIVAGKLTVAQTATDEDLLDLAKRHFNYESIRSEEEKKAFETFFQKTQDGEKVDLTPELKTVSDPRDLTDPVYAGLWQNNRVIKAEWLVWLCVDPKASGKVSSKGIDIAGARIDGEVDLSWVKVQFPLRAYKCAFTGDTILDRASLRSLLLRATYIKSLHGNGLTVEQDILLNEGFQAQGEVSLKDARIDGSIDCGGGRFSDSSETALNLENAKTGAIYLNEGFRAEGEVRLRNAKSGTVDCGGGQFINPGEDRSALNLENAKTGAVYLNRAFTAEGEVCLRNAESGTVDCDGGHFINPGEHENALNLENAKTGAVYLNKGFTAEGEVRLRNVESGTVDCIRGHFINPGERRIALNLENAKTGSVFLTKGFEAQGEVRLALATIGGDLHCHGGKFINCHRTRGALDASGANVQGDVTLEEGFEADGKVVFKEARIGRRFVWRKVSAAENAALDLQFAKAKTLINEKDEKGGWPGNLLLNGFVFDELDQRSGARSSAEIQHDWIRSPPGEPFVSQPYDQMAEAFRKMGRPEDAVKIMVYKNDDAGRNAIDEDWKKKRYLKILGDFFWYRAFGKLIDFGYHPWRALIPSVLFVLLGAALFELGFRAQIVIPTDDNAYDPDTKELRETYPKFNALIYSLETFVPLLKLGIGERWIPNANRGAELRMDKFTLVTLGSLLRGYFWIHIIFGWILTTLWVAGLTGLIKT